MTGNARLRDMRSRQRELRSAVVEGRGLPDTRIVTLCAIVRKAIGYMIRIRNAGEYGLVAGVAIPGSIHISRRVASDTSLCRMRSSQRKLRGGVIKNSR